MVSRTTNSGVPQLVIPAPEIRWVPNWPLILAVWLAVGSWVFLAVVARAIWLAVS